MSTESLHAFEKLLSKMDKETLNDMLDALPNNSHELSITEYIDICWNLVPPTKQKENINKLNSK